MKPGTSVLITTAAAAAVIGLVAISGIAAQRTPRASAPLWLFVLTGTGTTLVALAAISALEGCED